MKRAIAAVLCFVAPAAWGQTTLDYSLTHVGTYTPAGLTTPVGVYDLTFTVSPGDIGAIVLDVGADYLGYGGNPFQVGIQTTKAYVATPTITEADQSLATETFAYQTDSHFLFPSGWPVAVVVPWENNDKSLGTYIDPYGQTEVRGLGGVTVAVSVPVDERIPVIDIARIGIPADTVVYLRGQIVRTKTVPEGYGVEVRNLENVQLPMLYQNTWEGSGTGGLTSTDPNDPTVQWDHLGNWSRGVPPGLSDGVRVEMTNPGLLLASSGSVGSLYVDASSSGTSFQIPQSANVSVTGSLIVGEHGTAAASQSGTAHSFVFALGENDGACGGYDLTGGRLTVDTRAYVGKDGRGTFTQTAGTMQAGGSLVLGRFGHAQGTYRLQGGYLTAGSVWLNRQSLFHQAGGSLATECITVGRTSTFLLEDGEVQAPVVAVMGTFIQTGGKNIAADLLSVAWSGGGARYEMRGGIVNADTIYVGSGYSGKGASTFHLLGGEVSASTADLAGDVVQQGGLLNVSHIELHYYSTFQLHGGEVRTDLLSMGGTLAQNGGSLHAEQIDIDKKHSFKLDDGWVRAAIENVRGSFTQTGGTNVVTDTLAISTVPTDRAVYELWGGVLSATNITGQVSLLGGAFSVQSMDGVLVNDGGVISPGQSIGMMSLGGLVQHAGTLEIELGALGSFDQVRIADSAELGGILNLRSLSGYRPREGDSFPIITVTSWHPDTPYYQADFTAIRSTITTGLPGSEAFSGAANGQDYRVTFLGYTNGDANRDHIVDGGDLSLMGGNWMKGGARPFPGDANRDDIVDGGDLALMGGNWMETGIAWGGGDCTGDGLVDGGDLSLMGGNWMKRLMAWGDCDFTGDGLVDGGDLALMGGNWWWVLPPGPPQGVALPEPASAGLLLGAGLALIGTRRRK